MILINHRFYPVCLGLSGWELKRDREGITIHVRELGDNPLKEYKVRAVMAHPIRQVFDFLSDLERHPEWVFRCRDLTVIGSPDEHRVKYHTAYDIPWLVNMFLVDGIYDAVVKTSRILSEQGR